MKLLFLLRAFFEGAKEGFRRADEAWSSVHLIEEQPEHEQVLHPQFEEAILAWEKRTGHKVERNFSEGKTSMQGNRKIIEHSGEEWRNFSMFLGSKEAFDYRRNHGQITLTEYFKEAAEPDMSVVDDTYEDRIDELKIEEFKNEYAPVELVKSK